MRHKPDVKFALSVTTTVNQAIAEGAQRLESAGDREPRRTARALLAHVLDCAAETLIAHPEQPVEESRYSDYLALISRKGKGEPLQHLTGHQHFYGLDFIVSPDVLIPRPETEFVVERVLEIARSEQGVRRNDPASRATVADIGTGSGCIAVALATNLSDVRIVATDISAAALDIARANAKANGVGSKIEFLLGDMFEPLARLGLGRSVDIIASNPPYVPLSQSELVQREVREFEPGLALYGGADGLDFYRRLLKESPEFLKSGGHLVCEMGYLQLDAIRALVDGSVWEVEDVTSDLQGIPRTLTLRLL